MTRLSHREACYELRRHARLLETGKLTRSEWYEKVAQTLAQSPHGAPHPTASPRGRRA